MTTMNLSDDEYALVLAFYNLFDGLQDVYVPLPVVARVLEWTEARCREVAAGLDGNMVLSHPSDSDCYALTDRGMRLIEDYPARQVKSTVLR